MAAPPRFIIQHDATSGRWYVADRLLARVPYLGASLLSTARHAGDEEAKWRAQCQHWIEAEWRGTLL